MKETFDKITMDEGRQNEMRSALLTKKKATKVWLAPVFGVLAALAIVMIIPATRTVVVNAAEKLIEIMNFRHNGFYITVQETSGTDEDGNEVKGILAEMGQDGNYESFAQAKDGKLYFVLDGKWKDVTDKCSETDYYCYEGKNKDGSKFEIYIGGTPDDYGYCLFTHTKETSSMSVEYNNSDRTDRAWFKKAIKDNPELKKCMQG